MLKNKSDNISETRKDRVKVTEDGLDPKPNYEALGGWLSKLAAG